MLARKFVIDFEGGSLPELARGDKVAVRAETSHGKIVNPYATAVAGTARWRGFFDWSGELPPADEPVELRCVLVCCNRTLTETWLFAYFPQVLPRKI